MSRTIRRWGWALLILLVAARVESAVRVALIETDPKQTANVVALVEARLSAVARVELVERQQIEKLVAERQLQTALGADAVAGRAALGKLLQADLLVFLQQGDEPQAHLQVIVSETRQGLRLVRQEILLSDAEKAAVEVEKLIGTALDRQARRIREIFAVPPFVSDDLGFAFDHLKGACARVVEKVLEEQPDVLVVELNEAHALAKEIALAGGADPERPLPLYVLGRYRNEVIDQKGRLRISLKLLRGEQELAAATSDDLPAKEYANFLRASTTEFLAKGGTERQPAADSAVEARQLAERAQLLMDLGSWREALELIEASLLLQPEQPALRREAVRALHEFVDQGSLRRTVPLAQQPQGASRLDYFQRGLEHLELYMRATKISYQRDQNLIGGFSSSINDWGYDQWVESVRQHKVTPDYQAFWDARTRGLEMFLRVLADKSRRRVIDDTTQFLTDYDLWRDVDAKRRWNLHMKLLADFSYLPDQRCLLMNLATTWEPPPQEGDTIHLLPSYSEFLNKAREMPNDGLKKAAEQALKDLEPLREWHEQKRRGLSFERVRSKSDPDDEVTFTPLDLKWAGPPSSESPAPVAAWMPAGKGIDLAWNRQGLFLMKQPGVLRQIDARNLNADTLEGAYPRFDGRFVWIPEGDRRYKGVRQHLLVLDPEAETVVEIGTEQGLPECTEIGVTTLGPGRALVVGYFGQAFAAIVDFEPPSKATVKIIHEFRKVPKPGNEEQWRDPDVSFEPGPMYALSETTADGTVRQAGLVWRTFDLNLSQHPIVIDLPAGTVRPVDFLPSGHAEGVAAHDGVVEALGLDRPLSRSAALHRFSLSGTGQRPMPPITSDADLFEFGGALHCVHIRGWMIGGLDERPFHDLKCHLPACWIVSAGNVGMSSHYGPLLLANQKATASFDEDLNVYQVKFTRPLAELIKP